MSAKLASRLSLLLIVIAVAAPGCRRGGPSQPTPGAQGPAQTDAAGVLGPPPGIGMDGMTKPVMELMREERGSRPTDTPAAEAVFATASKAGVPTSDRMQVVARLLGASFCENARTDRGVVLSVCEFKDAETLEKGRAYSEKTFAKALPNRALLVNRKTLLTLNPPDDTAPVKAQMKTIADAFARL